MNENIHRPLDFPADRDRFLAWAMSEDDGFLSVGGLAIRCGCVEASGFIERKDRRGVGPAVGEDQEEKPKGGIRA